MKVCVAGSRSFSEPELIEQFVALLDRDCEVVTGGAKGVDTWAHNAAVEHGFTKTWVMEAQWSNQRSPTFDKSKNYDPAAGYRRNEAMRDYADIVVVFWDGESRGSKHMIGISRAAGKLLAVITRPHYG